MEEKYKQCKLKKAGNIQIAWIPESYAVLNKAIKIRRDGMWIDGWTVEEVYQNRKDGRILGIQELTQREYAETLD